MPCSSASHTTRTFSSGSSTSMRYGPTRWCMRSTLIASDSRTVRTMSPRFTVAYASMTPRLA